MKTCLNPFSLDGFYSCRSEDQSSLQISNFISGIPLAHFGPVIVTVKSSLLTDSSGIHKTWISFNTYGATASYRSLTIPSENFCRWKFQISHTDDRSVWFLRRFLKSIANIFSSNAQLFRVFQQWFPCWWTITDRLIDKSRFCSLCFSLSLSNPVALNLQTKFSWSVLIVCYSKLHLTRQFSLIGIHRLTDLTHHCRLISSCNFFSVYRSIPSVGCGLFLSTFDLDPGYNSSTLNAYCWNWNQNGLWKMNNWSKFFSSAPFCGDYQGGFL